MILDPSESEILNYNKLEQLENAKLKNPVPILQQKKAEMTTNTYIKPIEEKPPKKLKFTEFNKNFSRAIIGFMDDLYLKESNQKWIDYLPIIIRKENRYNYLGILFLLIALLILLLR